MTSRRLTDVDKEHTVNKTMKKSEKSRDFYKAAVENGSLFMTPHCACGNALNEDYFCEKCNKRCECYLIICDTKDTLNLVQKYIRQSPKFASFTAYLASDRL